MTWFRAAHYTKALLKGKQFWCMTSGSFEIFTPLRYNIITFIVSVIKTFHKNQIKFTFRMFRKHFMICVAGGFKIPQFLYEYRCIICNMYSALQVPNFIIPMIGKVRNVMLID